MTVLRLLLLALLVSLALPANALAVAPPSSQDSASEASNTDDPQPAPPRAWWEENPRASDGWRLGLQSQVRTHMNSWAIPVAIVGGISVTIASVGFGRDNDDAGIPGLIGLGTTACMAAAAFPTLRSISRALERYDDPAHLHRFLRRARIATGAVSLATGISGLVFGLLAPLTWGLTGFPSAILSATGVMLGHASLTLLVFELKVDHFVGGEKATDRFSRLPRDPAPPRLVTASPLGLRFSF